MEMNSVEKNKAKKSVIDHVILLFSYRVTEAANLSMIIFLYFSEDFGAVFLHVATRRFIGGLSHELSKTVLKPRVTSFKALFRTAIVQVRFARRS